MIHDLHLAGTDLQICGIYESPGNTTDPGISEIGDHILESLKLDNPHIFMIKVSVNDKEQLLIKALEFISNGETRKASLKDPEIFAKLTQDLQSSAYLKIVDVDDHFENPALDWRNPEI